MKTVHVIASMVMLALASTAQAQVVTQRTGVLPGIDVPTPAPDAPPPDYRIGVADVLLVNVWLQQDASGEVTVRPDGKITLPLGNDIYALGLTTEELKEKVVTELEPFIKNATVFVQVKQINSRNVYITGAVNKPGPYPLMGSMTVVQLITLAGGVLEFADKKNIMLISATLKDAKGQPLTYKINYEDIMKGKNVARNNIELRPGDQVIVR